MLSAPSAFIIRWFLPAAQVYSGAMPPASPLPAVPAPASVPLGALPLAAPATPRPPRFGGKVVLITGGASNIGRQAALAYAREGAKVVIVDADVFRSRDTLADLQEITPDCAWVRADLGWEDQVL